MRQDHSSHIRHGSPSTLYHRREHPSSSSSHHHLTQSRHQRSHPYASIDGAVSLVQTHSDVGSRHQRSSLSPPHRVHSIHLLDIYALAAQAAGTWRVEPWSGTLWDVWNVSRLCLIPKFGTEPALLKDGSDQVQGWGYARLFSIQGNTTEEYWMLCLYWRGIYCVKYKNKRSY